MGLINSDPLNVLVIFLKKGLVRKGVEWLCHQLFFPISIILPAPTSALQQPSSSAPCPRTAPEHHSPRSSPLTVVYRKFSQAEVAAPMLTMLSFFLSIRSCAPLQTPAVPHLQQLSGQERLCRCVFARHQTLQDLLHHHGSCQTRWSAATEKPVGFF